MSITRVLIVRTSAMGDVVHTLPLASALRRELPQARIGWVVERRFSSILGGNPAIDDILEIDLKDWRRRPFAAATWRQIRAFLARLQDFSADVVIDAMGNHKSGLIAALSFAGRTLGARREDRREPSSALWISEPVALTGTHTIDRTRSLIAGLGLPAAPSDIDATPPFADIPLSADTPPLLIHPSAGWSNKEYPAQRWSEVSRELHASTGLAVGILSAPGEQQLVDSILEAAGESAVDVPAFSLEALAGRLRAARLVLAGDTGPLHLAQALGTPVLCVLGPTDPRRNGAYRAPESNLVHPLPCSYCYKRFDEAKACLLAIEPQRIAAQARRLLQRTN